jgi:hypothetical protein
VYGLCGEVLEAGKETPAAMGTAKSIGMSPQTRRRKVVDRRLVSLSQLIYRLGEPEIVVISVRAAASWRR